MTTPTQSEKRMSSAEFQAENEKRCAIAVSIGGYSWFPMRFNKEQKAIGKSQEEVNSKVNLGGWVWDLAPDYFHDLNACALAENAMSDDQHGLFRAHLWELTHPDCVDLGSPDMARAYASATAALRAEAIWKTLCK